jgi:glycerophosphoryl diester phosphodiesterase
VELDVGLTRDDVVVVGHDPCLHPDIARGPDGRWLDPPTPTLRSLTFDQLQRFDVGRLRPGSAYAASFPDQVPRDGARMPRLADVYALAARAHNRDVRFNVEVKSELAARGSTAAAEKLAEAAVRAVREARAEGRTTLQSFDWRVVARVLEIAPEIRTSCLTSERPDDDTLDAVRPGPKPWLAGLDPSAHGGSAPRLVRAMGVATWSPHYLDLTAERMAEARALGLAVVVWTVNDPADMARLLDLGVDGMISDRPDRLRALAVSRGIAVPPPTPVTV